MGGNTGEIQIFICRVGEELLYKYINHQAGTTKAVLELYHYSLYAPKNTLFCSCFLFTALLLPVQIIYTLIAQDLSPRHSCALSIKTLLYFRPNSLTSRSALRNSKQARNLQGTSVDLSGRAPATVLERSHFVSTANSGEWPGFPVKRYAVQQYLSSLPDERLQFAWRRRGWKVRPREADAHCSFCWPNR